MLKYDLKNSVMMKMFIDTFSVRNLFRNRVSTYSILGMLTLKTQQNRSECE